MLFYTYIGYKACVSRCLDHVYRQFVLHLLLACTVEKTFSRLAGIVGGARKSLSTRASHTNPRIPPFCLIQNLSVVVISFSVSVEMSAKE